MQWNISAWNQLKCRFLPYWWIDSALLPNAPNFPLCGRRAWLVTLLKLSDMAEANPEATSRLPAAMGRHISMRLTFIGDVKHEASII